MGRNLLIGTSSPYPWGGSDYPNAVNLSTAGKVIHTDGSNHFDAYIWLHHRTCFVDPIYALHKIGEYLTLSVDVKIAGSSGGTTLFQFDLRHQPWGAERYLTRVYFTGDTDWKRIYLPLKASQAQNEESVMSLFCVDCTNCPIDTTVEWKNMKLEVGDTGSEWTPAPEEVLFKKLEESDVEPGAISTGNTVVAGQTLENMKSSDSSWLTLRVRTKNIIPLLGNTAFYVNFPTNLQCFPIYFDSSDLSIAAPCDAHTTKDVFIAPQGAVGVELVFKKSDNSEITPADVTSVSGGVLKWQP